MPVMKDKITLWVWGAEKETHWIEKAKFRWERNS